MLWSTVLTANFFNSELPLLRRKRSAFAIQDHPGLWRIHWQLGRVTLLSTFYTPIDQACWLWGVITVIIFAIAQYTPISWTVQALMSTGLTLIGTVGMVRLAQHCTAIKPLSEVIVAWALLMLLGLSLTDLGIFLGSSAILERLCLLWLALSAAGYFFTGIKLRSRTFFLFCSLHLLGIMLLPAMEMWQFMFTGMLMGGSAILLAELQWDSSGVCATHLLVEPAS